MRTMPMTWNRAESQANANQEPCIMCGKVVNPKRMWAIHIIDGGMRVLHPEDEHLYQPDAGEMGCHMVGSECRKQFGEFAFRWSHG